MATSVAQELLKRALFYGLRQQQQQQATPPSPAAPKQNIQGKRVGEELNNITRMESLLEETTKIRVATERLAAKFTIEAWHIPRDKVYQSSDVLIGQQNVRYWYYEIPPQYVFLIDQIASHWYESCTWVMEIDGDFKEDGLRIVGEPKSSPTNHPIHLQYPLVAKKWVEWRASNNSTKNRSFAAITDGILVPVTEADKMGGVQFKTG